MLIAEPGFKVPVNAGEPPMILFFQIAAITEAHHLCATSPGGQLRIWTIRMTINISEQLAGLIATKAV